jgi:hypothetical protein
MQYDIKQILLLHISKSKPVNEAVLNWLNGRRTTTIQMEEPEKADFDRLTSTVKTLTLWKDEYKVS